MLEWQNRFVTMLAGRATGLSAILVCSITPGIVVGLSLERDRRLFEFIGGQ